MPESIFAGFSAEEIGRIKEAGTPVTLPEGWSPIWENTPADKAYILLSGTVSVRRQGEEIATLGPGDIVGEASFVRGSLRTASVVALTPLAALHYTRESVERLCAQVPGFRDRLEETVAERIGGA
jgi:CRP-like cAMP-binding protein